MLFLLVVNQYKFKFSEMRFDWYCIEEICVNFQCIFIGLKSIE